MPGTRRRDAEPERTEPAPPPEGEQITKRRVTLTNLTAVMDEDGNVGVMKTVQEDYVREDLLAEYLRLANVPDAKTGQPRFANIKVHDGYDAGPAGWHGATYILPEMDHPMAGTLLPATTPEG
jgi:hypothetical protein